MAEVEPDHPRSAPPLVLLLHGFPQFWWAWRHQLAALGAAGYRTAAMDLRGFGASDKPPRGYDTGTSAADVAGVVRSLGASDAVVVGSDIGGWVAWSAPALAARTTRAVAVLSAAHPLQAYAALRDPLQMLALGHVAASQVPMLPERQLLQPGRVTELLSHWSGPGWPSAEEARCYEDAIRVPFVAHSAMEYYRWGVRSLPRPDGRRFRSRIRRPVTVPVLHVAGALDRRPLPSRARRSSRWVRGPYRFEVLDGVGHFPAEEAPQVTTRLLLDWLDVLR